MSRPLHRTINRHNIMSKVILITGASSGMGYQTAEALSDALRMETKQFGIDVVLIEPGGIKTDWGKIAADHLEESAKGGAYEAVATKAAGGMRKQYSGNMMSDPKVIVKAISRAVNSRCPRTRYLVGFGAKPLVFAHTILPTKRFDFIMMHAS